MKNGKQAKRKKISLAGQLMTKLYQAKEGNLEITDQELHELRVLLQIAHDTAIDWFDESFADRMKTAISEVEIFTGHRKLLPTHENR